MIWVWVLAGCGDPLLPEGRVVDDAWLRPASEVVAHLDVACAGIRGGTGPYDVLIDDKSGYTVLFERGTDKMWLREPFGTVSDRCWWVPTDGSREEFPAQDCALNGLQQGFCGADASAPDGWRFAVPGVASATSMASGFTLVDGVGLAPTASGLARLDLLGSADPPMDAREGISTRLGFLPELLWEAPPHGEVQIARADQAVVMLDDAHIRFYRRTDVRRSLAEPIDKRSAPADARLAAAGDVAVAAGPHQVDVWTNLDENPQRERRDHQVLRDGVLGTAVDPGTGDAYALVNDRVVRLGEEADVGAWPTPGAQGLVLGYPGDIPTVYAWGNVDGGGVIYRLDPDATATAARFDAELLGLGTGEVFQELVAVLVGIDGRPEVRGFLDTRQTDALPDDAVGLAFAAFIESPKDPELLDPAQAQAQLQAVGGCPTDAPAGLEAEYTLCCAQDERGKLADAQLAWLDQRIDRMALVIGVNPTSIFASEMCNSFADAPMAALGDRLPTVTADWLQIWQNTGRAAAAPFPHSAPFEPGSWWVGCPEFPAGAPAGSCWDTPQTLAGMTRFYTALLGHSSLAKWGDEPNWTIRAGGYAGDVPGVASWPDVVAAVALPDGAPAEDGLFFGNLGMDPRAPAALEKELAPDDARLRPFPIDVNAPADRWDGEGNPTGVLYWPGQTFSLEYLYEFRQSGLLFQEYIQIVGPNAAWATPVYRGDEQPDVMTHADFALEEHYLVTRVLADRDIRGGRWWTLHLGDLSRLRARGLGTGWVDEPEFDAFLTRIDGWSPALGWSARPPAR